MIFLLISNVFINDGDVFGIYVFFVLIGCYVCVQICVYYVNFDNFQVFIG